MVPRMCFAVLGVVMIGFLASPAKAQPQVPEVAGKIANSCVSQARDAAGTWRNACVELGGAPQECREEAQGIFTFVLNQCFSSMAQVFQSQLLE